MTGTTEADCTVSLSVSIAGTSTEYVDSATYTGTDFHVHQVSVTGGAEKTKKVSPTGVCQERQNDSGTNAGVAMAPNVVRVLGAFLTIGLLGVAAL